MCGLTTSLVVNLWHFREERGGAVGTAAGTLRLTHFLQLLLVGHWGRKPSDFSFPLPLLLHTVYPLSASTLLLQDGRGGGDTHFNYFFYRYMVRRLDSEKHRAVHAGSCHAGHLASVLRSFGVLRELCVWGT